MLIFCLKVNKKLKFKEVIHRKRLRKRLKLI
jgi:hypothetical protein